MAHAQARERSLCLLNSDGADRTCQPWSTITDAQFHPDVRSLYCYANVNPIQSIHSEHLPAFVSYLWPLVHRGAHVWAVDHAPARDTAPVKFVLKYDLLIWDLFYRTTNNHPALSSGIAYPKVLILAPDWHTCENTHKHLSNVSTDVLKQVLMCCIYEGQHHEHELYKQLLTHGCDLLVTTPTVVGELIQKRLIHFEQLQMIVYDQLDLVLKTPEPIQEILNLLQLHTSKTKPVQQLFLSRVVDRQTKDFIGPRFSADPNYYYLSSSMLETHSYKNFFLYCEPSRNWFERKLIVKETLDLAHRHRKKVLMCAYQTRRLATMQGILNDLSIQSTLVHSQLHRDEIEQHVHEWQAINDRPLVLLIQDEILHDIPIDNTDIIIHLDVQRLIWYQLFNQRMKLLYAHFLDDKVAHDVKRTSLTSLKAFDHFYHTHPTVTIPLTVILWPGDCAQVTYDLIDYIQHSESHLHPLIERLAKNNCFESPQMKQGVEFCPMLKTFGECLSEKKLKRCPYRHHFHYDVDVIEQRAENAVEGQLSDAFELQLPMRGEIELRVTHVSDGNRLWANILRARNDINQALVKVFDYDAFYQQVETAFKQVECRPLSEIVQGDIYLYADECKKVHRVYVHEQEQGYFDIRRADAILNRLLKAPTSTATATVDDVNANNAASPKNEPRTAATVLDRPSLTVFSLDTGITFALKSHEHLYPIEPSSLKHYPPLATEIILCNIYPLDTFTMTFTPFAIDTLRSLTLNEVFMGRIKLATRSCFWVDPLVKPVRLAALKRIAYDKPIRKQLILSKLVQANEQHMNLLEHLAVDAGIHELPPSQRAEAKEPAEPAPEPEKKEEVQEAPTIPLKSEESPAADDDAVEDFLPAFKPFVNRMGQLIINPVGRSKQFFSKHNQPSYSDPVGGLASDSPSPSQPDGERSNAAVSPAETTRVPGRCMPLGRGHRPANLEPPAIDNVAQRPQALFASNTPSQQLRPSMESTDSTVTTPSEIGPSKMSEVHSKTEPVKDANPDDKSTPQDTVEATDENDQMMFIFGPKLFSQLRLIKDMEDEQRRQADFPVQRNRNRFPRPPYPRPNTQDASQNNPDEENNESSEQQIPPPSMSRFEPFVGERGPLTQEQINYRQAQRKTRLFWEQTARDIYLTIGFYNVDSTLTRVEFEPGSAYCRTRIRTYDRFVRIHLAHDIVPEKSSFQVRRSNILLTMRKANEGVMWTALSNRSVEPRPDFFNIEYGSDDESDAEKRRRTINQQWEQIRDDKRKLKPTSTNDEEKFTIDDMDDEDQQHPRADKLNVVGDDEDKDQEELTDTSSDCHSTDSDDCYYEDQVPASHIPRGYDDADYDHRFYGQAARS